MDLKFVNFMNFLQLATKYLVHVADDNARGEEKYVD